MANKNKHPFVSSRLTSFLTDAECKNFEKMHV